MSDLGDEQELRRIATRRVGARRGFRIHATVYVLVNAGLALINLMTSPHWLWFLYVLGGWGIGLVAHAVAVYGNGRENRQKEIEAEMDRLRRRSGPIA
jgi:hypothetical protein